MTNLVETFKVTERMHLGGLQYVVKFPNGYGASIVHSRFSHGLELAVLKFKSETEYELTDDTPITDDTIGYLTPEEIDPLLLQIQNLPQDA